MCVKRLFVCVCVLCSLLGVKLHSEQWYRVSEMELNKLEAISQISEKDKQNWLSQASELKIKVQTLQTESKNLNSQLATERQMTQSLRQSFEQSATAQIQRASDYETEIASLKEMKAKADTDVLKIKNQRNILFFVLVGLIGLFSFFIYAKVMVH